MDSFERVFNQVAQRSGCERVGALNGVQLPRLRTGVAQVLGCNWPPFREAPAYESRNAPSHVVTWNLAGIFVNSC
jgi:hypothetical protein